MTRQVLEVVTFDKDSTIADTSGRHWLAMKVLSGDGTTWLDYCRACGDDKPIVAARELMYLLARHYPVHILTGSQDCPEAREWLLAHRFPYSHVRFRTEADPNTENGLLKAQWINEMQASGLKVRMHVDDHAGAAEVIEKLTGVPCLVLNPRYAYAVPDGLVL